MQWISSINDAIAAVKTQTGVTVGSRRTVIVTALEASNLSKRDMFGLSDPYATVCIQDADSAITNMPRNKKVKTDYMKKTLNPRWNTQFSFEACSSSSVIVEVFDHDRLGKDDFLGMASIPMTELSTYPDGQPIDRWYPLRKKNMSDSGTVCIIIIRRTAGDRHNTHQDS